MKKLLVLLLVLFLLPLSAAGAEALSPFTEIRPDVTAETATAEAPLVLAGLDFGTARPSSASRP